MYTQISIPASTTPEPSLIPDPAKFYNPQNYGGMAMLSEDKIVSCFGKENATNILDLPGATIISPILLSLTGIVGQITALFYLYRTTKPGLKMTVFYVLLATLIWTDLFGKLVTTPPAIISYAYGKWVGGMSLCHIHGFLMMTIGMVTHFLVAAMALDRFLCVRHGYFYKCNVTKSRIRLALMSIWLFCIVFCMMPLFGIGEYEPQYPGTWCYVNIHVGAKTWWCHRVYTNLFGLINIINVITILTCNVIVIGTLIAARIFRSRKFSASSRQTQKIIPITTKCELELQMSILLLVITIVFVVSWFPLDTLIFLNQILPHKCVEDHFKDVVAIRFASLNQIIDPWAYVICRKVFTSKIWRDCRSVIIGRNFSSKKQSNALNNNRILGLENGGSTKSRTNESLSSTKRKFSLPTPEKSKVIMTNFGIVRVDETMQRPPDNYGESQKKNIYKARKYGYNLDKGTSPYIPLCKTLSIKLPSNGIINPLESGYQLVSYSPVCRKQFRISSDVTEGVFNQNSQTESRNVQHTNKAVLAGRRHSWSSAAPSFYKQYRTRSTQTLENI